MYSTSFDTSKVTFKFAFPSFNSITLEHITVYVYKTLVDKRGIFLFYSNKLI